jgi:hypothetical protein
MRDCTKILLLAAGLTVLAPLAPPPALGAEELVIRYPRREVEGDTRSDYFIGLLELALARTADAEGPFRVEPSKVPMVQARAVKSLEQGKHVDLLWTMTSKEREQRMLPVRIPLLRGLLGYRVFIIRPDDAPRFAAIDSVGQLKALKAGQGADWPDTEILRANGLSVVTNPHYDPLWGMLERKRFDYFPRGINEPWAELRARPQSGFVVEETLALRYPTAIYYFVHRDNASLAARVERGLRALLADGGLEALLRNHESTREIFEKGALEQRRILALENPLLPEATPTDDPALWYRPGG